MKQLTNRELEVLKLIADGYTHEEAGERLNISAKTVNAHITSITHKLNIYGVANLTKYAISIGITTLDVVSRT